jgi:hypothetical protein
MISKALFINVAESMVIFGHGDLGQFGQCQGAERPAAGGQHHPANLLVPAGRERLEHRTVFAVDGQDPGLAALGQPGDQGAAHDQALLVGQGHRFTGLQRRPGASQPGTADDGRKHHLHVGIGHHAADRLRPDEQFCFFGEV